MSDLVALASWMLTHGVDGVLAIAILALGITVRSLHNDNVRMQAERLGDLRAHNDTIQKLNDRVHLTVDNFEKYNDAVERKRR